jgi:hypothetical protein
MKNLHRSKAISPLLMAAIKRERELKKCRLKKLFKQLERVIL